MYNHVKALIFGDVRGVDVRGVDVRNYFCFQLSVKASDYANDT
jgi:hypothetical protein